jgi:hypothetical protein
MTAPSPESGSGSSPAPPAASPAASPPPESRLQALRQLIDRLRVADVFLGFKRYGTVLLTNLLVTLIAAGVVLGTAIVFARAVDSSVTPGRERALSTSTRNGQVEVVVELADAPPSDVAIETKPSLSYGRLE